ncbi:hypothetical protein [Saccharopolyspora thermophila]|nr:hypothetical protein [Saccharopolyspora subtropica]
MGAFRELFPGRKLKHEGDESGVGQQHDPGGPLDLDSGVVYLAPPEQPSTDDHDETADPQQD